MRILHTADWHVGKTIRGASRADEHRAVLDEIGALALNEHVDIVLVAGDLFDVGAPTPESERIVYRALLTLAQTVEHVVVVSGNHDNPRRLEAIKPLLELTNVHVGATLERPADGGLLTISTRAGETADIALFPFLSQKNIVRADELMAAEAFERAQTYQDRSARIIGHLCDAMAKESVHLFLGHAMLHGGVMGGGERSAHTVFEYSIPTAAFPPHLHYVALGHLHRQQKLAGGCPIWYPGSPLQLDFSETEDVKAVNIVDVAHGKPAKVDPRSLASGKRLRTLRGTFDAVTVQAGSFPDDFLRIVVTASPEPGLADRVREAIPNTIDVRIEAPAIGNAVRKQSGSRLGRSPIELFSEYLAATGEEHDGVKKLFSELLDEAHATDQD